MRVLFKHQFLLFVMGVILTTYTLSASAGPAKDKKKLLEKLRNALNQTEVDQEAGGVASGEVASENLPPPAEAEPEAKNSEENSSEKLEEPAETEPSSTNDEKKTGETEKTEGSSTELQKVDGPASYLRKNLVKMRTVLRRIFDLFGFRQNKKKEGRQNRMLSNDDSYQHNGLEYDYYKEDIRTTVGAVLGEKDCIEKIVCGAGSYLRSVHGKNVILRILENVTPSAWVETMELLKKSAITDGECEYKCLEREDEDDDDDIVN